MFLFSLLSLFLVFLPDKLSAAQLDVETTEFSEISYDGTIKRSFIFRSKIKVSSVQSGSIGISLGAEQVRYNHFEVFEGMLTAYRDRKGHTGFPVVVGSNWIAYPVVSRNSYYIYHNTDFELTNEIRAASLGMGFSAKKRARIKRRSIRKMKRKGRPWQDYYLRKIRRAQALKN